MRLLLVIIVSVGALFSQQPPAPNPIVEARWITPINPLFAGLVTSTTVIVTVGVQNPQVGVVYSFTATVFGTTTNTYTLTGQIVPPIAPRVMSATTLTVSLTPGDSPSTVVPIKVDVVVPVTPLNGLTVFPTKN